MKFRLKTCKPAVLIIYHLIKFVTQVIESHWRLPVQCWLNVEMDFHGMHFCTIIWLCIALLIYRVQMIDRWSSNSIFFINIISAMKLNFKKCYMVKA